VRSSNGWGRCRGHGAPRTGGTVDFGDPGLGDKVDDVLADGSALLLPHIGPDAGADVLLPTLTGAIREPADNRD